MKYLYIVDVLPVDALLSNVLADVASYEEQRRVYLMTNFERPIRFDAPRDYWSSFLSAPQSGTVEGTDHQFDPVPGISHSGVQLNEEQSSGDLSLTLPIDHPVAQLFAYEAPAAQVWLTVLALDDADPAPVVQWTGRVHSAEYSAPTATLKCSHLSTVLRRPGLTRKHPRSCGHTLYSPPPGCGVNRHAIAGSYFAFREDGFLAEVLNGGLTLRVPEAANRGNGFFNEGFIAIDPDYKLLWVHQPRAGTFIGTAPARYAGLLGGYRRHITSHTGQLLHISAPLLTPVEPGTKVTVFAGCNLTASTCKSKFNNFANFGGYPYIPIKNVFESGLKG
ncbi:phage BR0599 family protein [Caldimonas thermodepolymerans]|uniref:Uncharacterized protein n=1 Tax=Caldimonas thermodepolymerans TaxID=215580 RepID=A0A2S5T3K7_9BURK|nr:phage BR0599 family protein [Caldimonas thermodepolymerans]PPE69509.1 hypothetical protein C1702_11240 [Caldimonas thermodepolymerans]QPC30977.1 phage BR0599 family protein [Caldimonas thermodepolymerans]RDH97009.1 putative phage uncharacterized protein [Caldimonas thermodepolymerans]